MGLPANAIEGRAVLEAARVVLAHQLRRAMGTPEQYTAMQLSRLLEVMPEIVVDDVAVAELLELV